MTWTPEPWHTSKRQLEYLFTIYDSGGNHVAEGRARDTQNLDEMTANAARIVSCVNGCQGLNPAAYRACVEALIKAVQMLEDAYEPKQGMSNDLRAPWDLEMDSVLPELKQALAQAEQT